jgi:signal peptidase II
LKKYIKDYLMLTLVAGSIVALDQWSKAFVRDSLPIGAIWSPWEWLTPYARIVHWQNTGVAFGMFQGQSMIFAVLALIVSGVIIYYYPKIAQQDWTLRLALGLQLAGALGNLIDRVTVGHVTDFISVGTFPVFNVADSSISVGVVVLLISVWLQERREKQNSSNLELEPLKDSATREE